MIRKAFQRNSFTGVSVFYRDLAKSSRGTLFLQPKGSLVQLNLLPANRLFHSSGKRYYEGDDGNTSSISSGTTTHRPRQRIIDIMRVYEDRNFTIGPKATIADAINHLVTERMSSTLITQESGEVLGIFTARDLLKFINDHQKTLHSTKKNLSEALQTTKITELMTKRDKLVYCSPNDSVRHCREIMFQLKIRNLPVLDGEEVKGIVTMKILADSYFNIQDTGGKKGFIQNVTGRKGIPDKAKISSSRQSKTSSSLDSSSSPSSSSSWPSPYRPSSSGGSSSSGSPPSQLDVEVAVFALPHPYKRKEGVSIDRRSFGAMELAMDLEYCEDAHFVVRVLDKMASKAAEITQQQHQTQQIAALADLSAVATEDKDEEEEDDGMGSVLLPGNPPVAYSQVYFGIADGVGSWREYGVDPRLYSHSLISNAQKIIENEYQHRALLSSSPFIDPSFFFENNHLTQTLHPLDIISDAWNVTTQVEQVVGSSTICIATLDKQLNQLSYSNIGDGGLMVLRKIDSTMAGTTSSRQPKDKNKNDLRIVYLAQQQLRSFNLPYQLGYSTTSDEANPMPSSFENPSDADTASIPIQLGDYLILGTDGLFDNVDLQEIVELVHRWEEKGGGEEEQGKGGLQSLAELLVKTAREYSLDKGRDSPFALLAKENDIMWGGGMPDDTTVIVAKIVQAPLPTISEGK